MAVPFKTLHTWRVVLAIALWLACASAFATDCMLRVGWWNSPPHSFRGPDGSYQGIEVELVTAVLSRIGCKPQYIELPLARALLHLETGQLDAFPGVRRLAEREKFAHFSKPMFRSRNMLFLHKKASEKYKIGKLQDISQAGFRLGVQRGAIYSPEYAELVRQADFSAHLTHLVATTNGWQMMALDRLDGILADELTAAYELRQLKLSHLIRPSIVISETEGRLAFSRKTVNPDLVERFDKALDAMVKERTYRSILEGFFHCKISPKTNRCS